MLWWQAFVLTLAIEMPIVLASLRLARIIGRPVSWRRAVAVVLGVNLLTHPVLWWIAPDGWALVVAEITIALVEGVLLWWGCRREWSLSFYLVLAGVANGCSFLAGLLLYSAAS